VRSHSWEFKSPMGRKSVGEPNCIVCTMGCTNTLGNHSDYYHHPHQLLLSIILIWCTHTLGVVIDGVTPSSSSSSSSSLLLIVCSSPSICFLEWVKACHNNFYLYTDWTNKCSQLTFHVFYCWDIGKVRRDYLWSLFLDVLRQ